MSPTDCEREALNINNRRTDHCNPSKGKLRPNDPPQTQALQRQINIMSTALLITSKFDFAAVEA